MRLLLSWHLAEDLSLLLGRLQITIAIWDRDDPHQKWIGEVRAAIQQAPYRAHGNVAVELPADTWQNTIAWLEMAADMLRPALGDGMARRILHTRESLQEVYEDTRDGTAEEAA